MKFEIEIDRSHFQRVREGFDFVHYVYDEDLVYNIIKLGLAEYSVFNVSFTVREIEVKEND